MEIIIFKIDLCQNTNNKKIFINQNSIEFKTQ